ncbi:MAG: DoxX family membrane protein [Myxococcota bacterium]
MRHSAGIWVAQLLASGFLAVLFLQSGLDKVLDWKGNREYIGGYLAKAPVLGRFPRFMLFSITVLEVLAGVLSAAGCLAVLVTRHTVVAFLGACVAGVALLGLFLGQRLAKDYAAAAGMVPYVIATVGAVLLQGAAL